MLPAEATAPPRSQTSRRRRVVAGVICAIFVTLVVVGGLIIAPHWPFTQENVKKSLTDASGSSVQFQSFHNAFFPHPGCVAEGVTFRQQGSGSAPLLAIQKLRISSSWFELVSKHIDEIWVEGAHVIVPSFRTGPFPKLKGSDVVINKLMVNTGVVDFQRQLGGVPLSFRIATFTMRDIGGGHSMPFSASLENPEPPGHLEVNGRLGSWNKTAVGQTSIDGSYKFTHADLSAFGGIAGLLSSDGKFTGVLNNIEVDGSVEVPNFEVKRSSHRVKLTTEFKALVDGRHGDVQLREAKTHIGQTTIETTGTVEAPSRGRPKEAVLQVAVENGHIQDLLYLFVRAPKAPMNGPVSLKGEIELAAGAKSFLKKIKMHGDFGVDAATFTNASTQSKMDKLSAKARGEAEKADKEDDPGRAVSELASHVVVDNGVATFSHLSFSVPGAKAKLHGTFNLINQHIDLHGMLFMEAKLPQATSGIKSFLLKAIDPFLKKNRDGGAKMPVSITGTYDHPVYKSDPV